MSSIADTLLDVLVRHGIRLERLKKSYVAKVTPLLHKMESDLIARIEKVGLATEVTTRRNTALLAAAQGAIEDAGGEINDLLAADLSDLAGYESEFGLRALIKSLPVTINFIAPAASTLAAIVTTDPLQGKLLADWVDGWSASTYDKVRTAINLGIAEGQTVEQVVSRIRGTKAKEYTDGLLEISRRNARSLVRTAVTHVSNAALETTYAENDDIIEGVRWSAMLAGNTCEICAGLDGQEFDLDEGPRPPQHINCRCVMVPITKAGTIMRRSGDLTDGQRASINGPVSASKSFDGWLRDQPEEFQDEYLGPERADAFRQGLTLDKFVDEHLQPLTLDELRDAESQFFD